MALDVGRWISSTTRTRPFIFIFFWNASILSGFADATLNSYVFARFQTELAPLANNKPEELTIPTFLTLFIFFFIYQLALVVDALRLKNTIQIIGLVILNLASMLYAAIQRDQIRDAFNPIDGWAAEDFLDTTSPFLVAVPCVIAAATMLLGFVAWKLYNEFAWTIYKHISADLRLKRRYLAFQVGHSSAREIRVSGGKVC